MSLGLKRGTVEIVSYDPLWTEQFDNEKTLLFATLENKLQALEHIGSTSVPGLSAKPIIDMIGAVDSFEDLDYFIMRLQTLGYEYMPGRMFSGRKFFPKGPPESRTHHLNLVIKGDMKQWDDPLSFRDYLRANTHAREAYTTLKSDLAKKYRGNREAYTIAKNDFIQSILRSAE